MPPVGRCVEPYVSASRWATRPLRQSLPGSPQLDRHSNEQQLRALLERARDGFARLDAGEIDAFELDELIHRYKRAARELWSSAAPAARDGSPRQACSRSCASRAMSQTGGRPARPAAGKAEAALTVPPGWTTRQHCQDPTVGVAIRPIRVASFVECYEHDERS
jgi:hypothetical protein